MKIRSIKEVNEFIKAMLENYEEPTIIVLFGDHQPYIEDEFYEKLLSKEFNRISNINDNPSRIIRKFK